MSAETGQAGQAGQANQQQGDQQQGGGWGSTFLRWIMMYYVINFVMSKWRGNNNTTNQQTKADENGAPIEIPISQQPHKALWGPKSRYNLRLIFCFFCLNIMYCL